MALTRFVHPPVTKKAGMTLGSGHAAVTEGRSLFPSTVGDHPRILIDGVNQSKIGKVITKGEWKGFKIYTLTLEERATCPRSCSHWRDCYGNRMHFARRHRHGPEFELRLFYEVGVLSQRHQDGFAVRLHILGDFYSVEYVDLWETALDAFPQLHVFGFTARWDDDIGRRLRGFSHERWRLRFSNAPIDAMSTVTVEFGEEVLLPAIQCPQQTGKTVTCGTCALCWSTERPIAFIQH